MINFAHPSSPNFRTGLVYGNIRLTKLDKLGNVKLGGSNGLLDNYGFETHKGGNSFRNIATRIGKAWADFTTFRTTGNKPYDIYVYGTGKLNK